MMARLSIRERVPLTILVSLLVTIFVRHTLAYGWSAAAVMAAIGAFVWAISPRKGGRGRSAGACGNNVDNAP